MNATQARLAMLEHRPQQRVDDYGLIDVRCTCRRAWPCGVRRDAEMTIGEPPWWVRLAGTARRYPRSTALFALTSTSIGCALILTGAYNLLIIDDQQLTALTVVLLIGLLTMVSVLSAVVLRTPHRR